MDTDHDSSWLGRVAQGSHEVKDRGDAELTSGRTRVLHGWVVGLSKQEAEAVVLEQRGDLVRFHVVDSAANLFQDIG